MRLSAKAEYACLAVLELAQRWGDPRPAPAKLIADEQGIPSRFLVQALLQLKAGGLVESVRGMAGGYRLVRAPEEVALADVLALIDGPPRRRGQRKPQAASAGQKALAEVWGELAELQQSRLREISFAELLRRQQSGGESYVI